MVKVKKILFFMMVLSSLSGTGYSDITWATPVTISTPSTDALHPDVVIDVNGNATSAWVESGIIQASSLPFGGSWSSPVAISNNLNVASDPKLQIDGSGNVTAMWIENTVVESATLPFSGSWSAETAVSGAGASELAFVVDASGNAVAIWTHGASIESSTRISGTWGSVSVLALTNSNHPDVALSSYGNAIAVWHTAVSGSENFMTSIQTIGTNTWSSPISVFALSAAYHHDYPKIAIDAGGNAVLAWFRYNFFNGNAYQNVQVLTTSLPQGLTAWGVLPTFLSNEGIRNPADLFLKLEFDIAGNALAVWTNSYDGETFSPESSQKLFGSSWLFYTLIQAPTIYSFGMDIAIAEGTALLTGMVWDGTSDIQIQSQELDINPIVTTWTSGNSFATGSDNAYPKCALSLSGSTFNSVAVWEYFDGSNTVIHAATGSESTVSPPSSVSYVQNVANFGVYSDYYNTITWTASSDPSVIQYDIYRNGVFFASTDASTLTFVDHNQIQGGTVTYGVAAINSSFRQSSIANSP